MGNSPRLANRPPERSRSPAISTSTRRENSPSWKVRENRQHCPLQNPSGNGCAFEATGDFVTVGKPVCIKFLPLIKPGCQLTRPWPRPRSLVNRESSQRPIRMPPIRITLGFCLICSASLPPLMRSASDHTNRVSGSPEASGKYKHPATIEFKMGICTSPTTAVPENTRARQLAVTA